MINGPGELHWCTLYNEDDEPYGETCRCSIGRNHEHEELPAEAVVPVMPKITMEDIERASRGSA